VSKSPKKLPVYLTDEETKKLFAEITIPRDRVMLQAAYFLGLRVSELVQLRGSDLNLRERVVIVRAETAKGNKERHIPIPEKFMPIIKQWLSLVGEDVVLFPLSPCRVWQLCKKYGELAGITKRMSPHVLRHSYATQVYNVTDDIALVKELLGHANIATTMIYTHIGIDKKKKSIEGVFR
jgi:integrase/recombinase XerD